MGRRRAAERPAQRPAGAARKAAAAVGPSACCATYPSDRRWCDGCQTRADGPLGSAPTYRRHAPRHPGRERPLLPGRRDGGPVASTRPAPGAFPAAVSASASAGAWWRHSALLPGPRRVPHARHVHLAPLQPGRVRGCDRPACTASGRAPPQRATSTCARHEQPASC
eukprot:scaffold1513_cov177-Isochrysis_galbana.AAC.3